MKACILLLVLGAHAATVSCRPKRDTLPRVKSVDLKDAVDKTVCPIRVVLDVDEARVPKVIKTIRCATGRARHCCHTHSADKRASCTELRDDVLVYYPGGTGGPDGAHTVKQTVSVGCVCMLQDFADGNTTPDPDLLR